MMAHLNQQYFLCSLFWFSEAVDLILRRMEGDEKDEEWVSRSARAESQLTLRRYSGETAI